MTHIREQLLQQRKALAADLRHHADHCITNRVLSLPELSTSQHIACYHAYAGEVATQALIEAILAANKHCYLPVINTDKTLSFVRYTTSTVLKKNQHGIVEPSNKDEACAASALDLVLTPLVGFDQHGHRIGWGLGHYDRAFAFLTTTPRPKKPFLVGLAYELQRVDSLEQNPWDVTLDAVVTEKNVFYCHAEFSSASQRS